MATVTRENIGLLNDKILVTVAKDDYQPSFEKAIKNYSKQANIPGFRKGMVPSGMVKKMYGASIFADEVLKSVEKGLSDYMTNEKLDIFAQPLPLPENEQSRLDMNSPSDYVFAFEVGLKPDFKVADLAKEKLTRYKVTVTDAMVDEEVGRLQTRNGKMTEPETVTGEDNVLNVTFIEADAAGNETEGGIRKENSLLVKYFKEPLRSSLTGIKKGDSPLVKLSEAFDDKEREWILRDLQLEEKDADKYFRLLVTKVGLVEKAELDDNLFKAAYPDRAIATEAELREAVKEGIQQQWDAQSRNQLFHQIYHAVLEHTNIVFPESFLKRWMQKGGEHPKTEEEVDREYPSFVDSLKWTLIIDKLVTDNGIEVKQDDLREFAKQQLFSYMGGSMPADGEQPWIHDYVERMMKDRKFVEDSFHRVQTDKVFLWAESQVKPSEKAISVEDFTKMEAEHHHHH